MSEQSNERVERRDHSSTSEIHPAKETNSPVFQKNGLEHFNFSTKSVVTWGILTGIAGLIFGSISVYRSIYTEVGRAIEDNKPLNERLLRLEINQQNFQKDLNKIESDLEEERRIRRGGIK